jgi:hypothetical protein
MSDQPVCIKKIPFFGRVAEQQPFITASRDHIEWRPLLRVRR